MKIRNVSAFLLAVVLSFSVMNCISSSSEMDDCANMTIELSVEDTKEEICNDDPAMFIDISSQKLQNNTLNFAFQNKYIPFQLNNPLIKPPIFI